MVKKRLNLIRDYLGITLGCLILAGGISIFTIDAKIIPGGVTGIATTLNFISDNTIGVGISLWLMNLPLYVWGLRRLGKEFGMRTFFGFTVSSFFIDLLRGEVPGLHFIRPHELATIQNMLTNDFLLYITTGGILVGIGLGIVFKFRATTGGIDIVAAIARQRFGLKPGQVFIVLNIFIVSFGAISIHFKGLSPERPAITLALYSIIMIVASSRLIDKIIDGFDYANSATIISTHYDEISREIMRTISRGATAIRGRGLYLNVEREIIFTVVTKRELPRLIHTVKSIDPHAFVIINNVHEVLGEGFRPRI
ncbi:MAG: YitT family protein [Desulfobacterium sp.]|nr:YitT family protein [Desulfobacterium sp.]